MAGGIGFRVEDPSLLDGALKAAFESDMPAIIDVVVDPELLAPVTKKV
ncbi:MAG: hypothetical protein Q6362_010420 [Candidatus Wukongarchaeota archaeon]|nr:hypothetical protein [Candidatus Wukongarchaeota archaeon]